MPKIALNTLLDLVGELRDSEQPNSESARFRRYLQKNVQRAEDLRDYVEDALQASGDQFNKALQDLINHVGQCLGFEVTYGRYRGVRGAIGFDGLWQSPTGTAIVIETKTTDVYTVKTATLLGYINDLVSEGRLSSPDSALGIYVYGRFDAHTSQLDHAIVAENRREKLRVVSMEALLNLLALKQDYELSHRTVLRLLLPAPVRIDPLINLIADIVAQEKEEGEFEPEDTRPRTGAKSEMSGAESEVADSPATYPTRKDSRATLASLDETYTGQSATAFVFDGKRYPVHTWKEIAVTLFERLWARDPQGFEEAALAIRGRKRPYFTRDKTKLRYAAPISNTDLFFESNLGANYLVKLCYTVLEGMGIDRELLQIEAEG